MINFNNFIRNENLDPLYNHNLRLSKGYTPDYENNMIYGKVRDEHFHIFKKAYKFHSRGLNYKEDFENFLKKYKIEITDCDSVYGYVYFKTDEEPKETIIKLQDTGFFEWLDFYDKRDKESMILRNIGDSIIEFSDEYSEHSDIDIKQFIEDNIKELTELRNTIK